MCVHGKEIMSIFTNSSLLFVVLLLSCTVCNQDKDLEEYIYWLILMNNDDDGSVVSINIVFMEGRILWTVVPPKINFTGMTWNMGHRKKPLS